VGRVDQAETALGAEMRLAADKGKGKKTPGKNGGDKIVKRFVAVSLRSRSLTNNLGSCTRYTPTGLSSTKNSSRTIKRVTAFRSVRVAGKTKRTSFGICVLDSSTSEFNLSAFTDDVCRTKLETMLRQLRPKEILFTKVD
jgi:DNA mismatch repair protein MSH6